MSRRDATEPGAGLVDRPPLGEAEDLIAATVCEDGPIPPDEAVESAAPRNQVVARPEIEVIRVAEHDLRAGRFGSRNVMPLTAPCVPTAMKAGVSI